MTQDPTVNDEMHYDVLAQDALRGVVKAALKRAAAPDGLPGDHHFYITFKTKAAGVSGPADLLGKYPDEMTIVLQHRYKDLAPGETFFAVTLSFDGVPRRLSIPYAAVTRFYDPSVQFLLQFEPPPIEESPPALPGLVAQLDPADGAAETDDEVEGDGDEEEDGAKIVSLDQFRKK